MIDVHSHVPTHRDRVPESFAAQIDLAAHQKAADYTCAKTRLGYINIALDTALLLALTLSLSRLSGMNSLLWTTSKSTYDTISLRCLVILFHFI